MIAILYFFVFLNGVGLEIPDIVLTWDIRVRYVVLAIPRCLVFLVQSSLMLPSVSVPDLLLALHTSLPLWDHPCDSAQKNSLSPKKKV